MAQIRRRWSGWHDVGEVASSLTLGDGRLEPGGHRGVGHQGQHSLGCGHRRGSAQSPAAAAGTRCRRARPWPRARRRASPLVPRALLLARGAGGDPAPAGPGVHAQVYAAPATSTEVSSTAVSVDFLVAASISGTFGLATHAAQVTAQAQSAPTPGAPGGDPRQELESGSSTWLSQEHGQVHVVNALGHRRSSAGGSAGAAVLVAASPFRSVPVRLVSPGHRHGPAGQVDAMSVVDAERRVRSVAVCPSCT